MAVSSLEPIQIRSSNFISKSRISKSQSSKCDRLCLFSRLSTISVICDSIQFDISTKELSEEVRSDFSMEDFNVTISHLEDSELEVIVPLQNHNFVQNITFGSLHLISIVIVAVILVILCKLQRLWQAYKDVTSVEVDI